MSCMHEDERAIGLLRHILESVLIPRQCVLAEMSLDFREAEISITDARRASAVR